ncbi:MAG: oligosaccharide flippase family protein [Candidatus Zixiibacteriota bacterium]
MSKIAAAISGAIRNAGAKGFFHLFSANIVISVLAFGSQLLVIKFLTPSEMADIKTMQSFAGIGAIIAGFGFNAAVLKLCSESRPEGERSAIFRRSLTLTIPPILAVLVVGVIAAWLGLFSPEQRVNQWMIVFLLSIPATVITSLIMMYLQARKQIKLMATTQTAIRVIGLTVIVAASYVYGFQGFVAATVIVATAAVIPLLRMVRADLLVAKGTAAVTKIWYYARWSMAANLVAAINSYLDILMLNYLVDDRVGIGFYSVATIFVLGLNQATATVQAIATPYFSEYSHNEAQFMRVLRKYQKLLILLALVLTAISMIVVPWFIQAVYGDSYAQAGMFFRILAVKYFLWSCYALLGIAIWGIGKMKFSFYSVLAALIVSSVVSYWLILDRGIQGAAIAQVVSYLLNLIIVAVMTKLALRDHFARMPGKPANDEGIK